MSNGLPGRWLLCAAIFFSVLAMGSFESIPLLVTAAVVATCVVSLSWAAEPFEPRRSASILFVTGVGLTAWTFVQTIPLPSSVVAFVSPHAADVWERALLPLGEPGPQWESLSLDATATRIEVLKGIVYLGVFVSALRIARHRTGVLFLERIIIASGVVVAVVAMLHESLGLQKVYGFYVPRTGVSSIAPLMNTNHLAGYLDLALIMAFGGLFSSEPPARQGVLGAVVVALVAAEIWLGSRGAVGAMVTGIVLVALLSIFARRRTGKGQRFVIVVPVLLAIAGAIMMTFGASRDAFRALSDTDVSKLAVAKLCITKMAAAYPLFGVGRGAFESTFPEFRVEMGFAAYTQPENLVAQWTTEWGFPIALLGFGAIVYALRPTQLFTRSRPPVGAWVALAALALQNLVDFSSEAPGVMVALTVCAALVVAGERERGRKARPLDRWTSHPRIVGLSFMIATIAVGASVFFGRSRELLDAETRIGAMAKEPGSATAFDRALRAAMLEHPAEPYFPYVGATVAYSRRSNDVPRWATRALERAPVYGPAHLVLARWLRPRSRSQARLEYRLAQEQGLPLGLPAAELTSLVVSYEDALEIAQAGEAGIPLLELISSALVETLPATAARLDEEILRRDPTSKAPQLRGARYALMDLEQGAAAPWCAREERCVADALDLSEKAEAISPLDCEPHVILARVLLASGEAVSAVRSLREATDHVTDRPYCLEELARLAIDAKSDTEATQAIDALAKAQCLGADECLHNLFAASALEEQRGNSRRALVYLRRAAELAPERDGVLEQLAQSASRAGLHGDARATYAKLLARHPGDPRIQALVAAEDSAMP